MEPRRLTYLRQNRCTRLSAVAFLKKPKKSSRVTRGAKSRMRRTETPKPIWIKFCMVVDIPDVLTYTNFCDHRLRGFWVAGVKFPPLPLTFIVALTTVSHECVIMDLENFATASRRYTGDIHNSTTVGLFITPIRQRKRLEHVTVECTCLLHIGPP